MFPGEPAGRWLQRRDASDASRPAWYRPDLSMRTTTLTLLAVLVGCSSGPEPAVTPPPTTAQAPAAPTPPPEPPPGEPVPVEPTPVEGGAAAPTLDASASAAMQAYRAVVAAYGSHDAEAYFGSFVDPMTCFHGERGYATSRLREARGAAFAPEARGSGLHVVELDVVRSSAEEVVLLDRGIYWIMAAEGATQGRPYMQSSSDPIEQGVHERAIVMRLVEGYWRIAAETDRAHLDCIEPAVVLDEMPGGGLQACRLVSTECLRRCDEMCTGCGSCNSCNVCPGECLASLAACTGAPDSFLPGGE